jgi:hypothetical protein
MWALLGDAYGAVGWGFYRDDRVSPARFLRESCRADWEYASGGDPTPRCALHLALVDIAVTRLRSLDRDGTIDALREIHQLLAEEEAGWQETDWARVYLTHS